MKLFSAAQIREWDKYTIQHEPVNSIDLMERAAMRCVDWILQKFPERKSACIFCGPGNNGGDGLAIARLLALAGRNVSVFLTKNSKAASEDFKTNLERLKVNAENLPVTISEFYDTPITEDVLIIDAIFGSGLNRPVSGETAEMIRFINRLRNTVIAIDLPSGLSADEPSQEKSIVEADYTISFQIPKLAFLVPDNEKFTGEISIVNIGLSQRFAEYETSQYFITDPETIHVLKKARPRFSHKGTFGHSALIAGSYGMLGAAILCGKACLRSGVGKISMFCTEPSYPVLQSAIPESIFIIDEVADWKKNIVAGKFQSFGIGPGLGKSPVIKNLLIAAFNSDTPLVLDADAINCISENPDLLNKIPEGTIITPHLKEFERLFGSCRNGFERMKMASAKAIELGIYIILKGNHSMTAMPDGKCWFNNTGNPGMATAGTGDVLTGMLTGFLAQGYPPADACILAVYIHGLAGDIAVKTISEESLTAGDLVESIGAAFLQLHVNSRS